jgi:alpha-mannosidase
LIGAGRTSGNGGDGVGPLEARLESCSPETEADAAAEVATAIEHAGQSAAESVAARILTGAAGTSKGYLLLNPMSFARRVAIELPELDAPPAVEPPVVAGQVDPERKCVVADVPAMGFTWISSTSSAPRTTSRKAVPLADNDLLRNEFCEAEVDPETGGLRAIRDYARGANRLGLQLAMLIAPRPSEWDRPVGPATQETYSRMVARAVTVTSSGPALGEIVTEGDLFPPESDERLAGYRQRFRLWKGRPVLEVEVTLDLDREPEGNPWQSYYAARFAWADEQAAITRSVHLGATATSDRRWEAPHYVEIGTGGQRTAILTAGLPFLRRHGSRMADLILVVEGERSRTFRFGIGIDLAYPIPAALDLVDPVRLVAGEAGPPRSGDTGWFFHLDVKNVVVTSLRLAPDGPEEGVSSPTADARRVWVHLVETEGRPVRAKLRCLRPPAKARQIDFRGNTLSELTVAGDEVLIDLTAHEIARLEIAL